MDKSIDLWIDLSHWETERGDTKAHVPFDWTKFHLAGGVGATIRSTYMSTPLWSQHGMKNDVQYWKNIFDAQSAAIQAPSPVVSYHLYEMKNGTWQEQADYYLKNTNFMGHPGMGDFELKGSAPLTDVRRWLEYVEERTNRTPWFYAAQGWIRQYCKPSDTWLRHYPLVIANYDTAAPVWALPWFPFDIIGWQFSQLVYAPDYGVVNGNKGAALYGMKKDALSERVAALEKRFDELEAGK